MYIIGIDPDIDNSGVAVFDDAKRRIVFADAMPLPDLILFLVKDTQSIKLVRIEAGWLNKRKNYKRIDKPYYSLREVQASEARAYHTGRNHEIGMQIEAFCKYHKIKYQLIKPSTKKWDATTCKKITQIATKNQDVIDAIRLAL